VRDLAVLEKWTKAFAASDVDGIVQPYAPDALFVSKTKIANRIGCGDDCRSLHDSAASGLGRYSLRQLLANAAMAASRGA